MSKFEDFFFFEEESLSTRAQNSGLAKISHAPLAAHISFDLVLWGVRVPPHLALVIQHPRHGRWDAASSNIDERSFSEGGKM